MLDEQKLAQALQNATRPLSDSLKDFGVRLDDHRMDMARSVTEIKTDIRYLKDNQKEAWEQIDKVREKWPVVEQFLRKDEITSTIKLNKPSVSPGGAASADASGGLRFASASAWCIKLAPLILSVAIGLIGLGFYMSSGSTEDAVSVMKEIRALADKTTKLTGEMQKVQEELEDGGVE